ncbi:MAG: sulfotransferase [Cyanobacteria bacterium J06631_6]
MSTPTSHCNLGAVFGAARSGTTWLGAIVASHPEVVYRFEPFHRLNRSNVDVRDTFDLVRSDAFSTEDICQIYNTLIRAYPELEKPPFLANNSKRSFLWTKYLLWLIARKYPIFSSLYTNIYTPKDTALIVFKEVDYSELFLPLLKRTQVPLVYIVRHPCACIFSTMKGQEKSLIPTGRRSVLNNLLARYEPELAQKYGSRLDKLKISEQEALLWLIEVRRSFQACQEHSNGLTVFYEQLTKQPLETSEQVFQHLGLSMTQKSVEFIAESTNTSSSSSPSSVKRGELGINSYFTVFRDPQKSRDRWKTEMPKEDQQRVKEIVADSEVFRFGVEKRLWD